MVRKTVARTLTTLVATAACGLALQTPAMADTTLVDQSVPGPIGGAQICAVGVCAPPANGITNVRIKATTGGTGIGSPGIATGSAPGCTANVNVAAFAVVPGFGGTVHATVSWDRTDMNGNVIPGSHESITQDVDASWTSLSVPLASVCATVL